MTRILAGLDGSDRSLVALAHADVFARHFGHELVAAHVVDPVPEETIMPDKGRMRVAARAAKYERFLAPLLKKYNARFSTVLLNPGESVGDALRRAAANEGAAIVALGSRGASGVHRKLLGGVALGLLADSSLPLLLTGGSVGEPASQFGPILGLSDDAIGGAALARALHPPLASARSEFIMLHLQPQDAPNPLAEPRFANRIEAARRLLPPNCHFAGRFETVPTSEDVLPRILAIASEIGAGSFALATSGHRLGRRLWGASTALRLLEVSPIPLIVVSRK